MASVEGGRARRRAGSLRYYWRRLKLRLLVWRVRRLGPPRVLMHDSETNIAILRAFGARIGRTNVRIHAPLVLHAGEAGYENLTIGDGCILSGNVYLDLTGEVVLREGVSLGPGTIVMTHNRFNYNPILEERLAHQCGVASVTFEHGSSAKAGAIVAKGVTIGANSVVAAGAVVTRDVDSLCWVAGIPARIARRIETVAPVAGAHAVNEPARAHRTPFGGATGT